MNSSPASPQKHAVIIGASMAGLMACRVLSDHFEQVTLIEKDLVKKEPESRKGQPHTRHLHGLLAHGFNIMQTYFPQLKEELTKGGAVVNDMGGNMRWFINGNYRARISFGQDGVLMSRPFLESLIRKAVLQRPNVRLLDQCAVKAPIFSEHKNSIIGLEYIRKTQSETPQQIFADLVVDASGRGSVTPRWLESMGYPRPSETTVGVKLGYASCIFKRDADRLENKEWVFITPGNNKETRMGGAFPMEDNRWMVTLAGMSGDHPGDNMEAFLDFAKALPAKDVYEIVRKNEALTDVYLYKYPLSLRRHYEKLKTFPEGFLVIGDAICSFNPIYGQGMTVAAMEIQQLDGLLKERQGNLKGLARAFFKKAKKVVDIPWQTAVGEDFRFPGTEGTKPMGTDLINAYIERIHNASHHDEVVGKAFLKVMNLMHPPTSLFHPSIVWRTLFKKPKVQNLKVAALSPQPIHSSKE
ncbi:MAG: hypothetical protein R2828_24130 [Saprospiraceae bacterium]